MFAVIKTGGKQYRVAVEDVVRIEKLEAETGSVVEFGEVLVVGGEQTLLGAPTVAGATVGGEVLDHTRGPKVIAFKKRRRKNSRRKRGHRQEYTVVRITEILTAGRKPSSTPPPRPGRHAVAAMVTEALQQESAEPAASAEIAAADVPHMPVAAAPEMEAVPAPEMEAVPAPVNDVPAADGEAPTPSEGA